MQLRTLIPAVGLLVAAQAVRAQDAQSQQSQQDFERSALIAAKSDLRNLIVAQEAYYADHSAYASSMDGLKFQTSNDVTVRFTATQNNGWAAESRNALLPNVACTVWINVAEKDRPKVGGQVISPKEGEPTCGFIEAKKP